MGPAQDNSLTFFQGFFFFLLLYGVYLQDWNRKTGFSEKKIPVQ